MDFESIEKLSPDEISELYNDIAEKDNLACMCVLYGQGFIDATEEILTGVSAGGNIELSTLPACDSDANSSHAGCRKLCDEFMSNHSPYNFIGPGTSIRMVYLPLSTGHVYVRGFIHSWSGRYYASAGIGNCVVPPDAECSGDGWSRYFNESNGNWFTSVFTFNTHCRNE